MGGALIVGQGTTPDDAIADYMQQVKEAQERCPVRFADSDTLFGELDEGIGLYPEAEPEVVASKGQYLAVGHVHS